MKQRGRESAAAHEVVPFVRALERVERPQPPPELTDEQAVEWRGVVDRLPADWFARETHPLLVEYCCAIVRSRRVRELIAKAEEAEVFDLQEYDRLGKMAEREARVIAAMATKMRLSQQTTYDKSKKKPLQGKNPWD